MIFRSTLFPLFVAWLTSLTTAAQVTGTLVAPNGKPVAGAEIFINRSYVRAQTDDFGQFTLNEIPPGLHEIVAYKKGFVLYRAPMRIQADRSYTLNLQYSGVEKKRRGKTTPESQTAFDQAFLGQEGLLMYNPDTHVEVETADGKFRVFSGPVVTEYPNAGYRITAYFSSNAFLDIADAAYCYQEYQGSNVNQNMAVERTRLAMYQGSFRHWLASTVSGKSAEEGFNLTDVNGQSLPALNALPTSVSGYYRINWEGSLIVHYKEKQTIVTFHGPVDFTKTGIMINPRQVQLEGAMNTPGLTYQLPIDYQPIHDIESTYAEALRYFYEKVYVQTDKPYYYPGEPLWFKAYLNYYNRSWRDSLCDVLYVELLSAKKQVIVEKMFRIEKGTSHGDFILPDSMAEGTYYLRAYTNLRLNFGDSGLFTKPLRILNMMDKADPSAGRSAPEAGAVSIVPRQKTHRVRDKVTLDIRLEGGPQGADSELSVAVTDAAQVIPVPEPITIVNTFPIDRAEIPRINELEHRIERGVSFYAEFLNDKGEGEKTQLSFIKWKTGDVLFAETDEDGKFWQTGLQFTDSALFSYKSDKAKGRPYGKVVVLPREIPPLHVPFTPEWSIVKVGTAQRLISEYEVPKDSKLLEEIEIKGRRESAEETERAKRRIYGRADYTLTAKNLNVGTGNLLYALVGKVPGLIVNPGAGTVFFARAYGSSITNSISPLVTINDMPIAGDAGTVLQTIDFNTIESIEFTKRLNSLYGSQGANGVIAVYTKTGASIDNTDPNFQTIKLPGFAKTRTFQAPDYELPRSDSAQPDYRATLYWNPKVRTDASGTATVSFFASDLAGLYRVVVEGITAEGRPVRGEVYLTIEEKP